jgi:hypothetical protein
VLNKNKKYGSPFVMGDPFGIHNYG